ncbi:MAG: molybdenum cofactor guanylyltransferase MobA [Gammaproteobacteria bacterium]|nr:molybdenum cofactor guanylyltransferase MobA [Gammaproteobacteria bacterium]
MPTNTHITGLILAGGRARRMEGQDKGLIPLHGEPMVRHVFERLLPQVDNILINANRNIETYQQYAPVIRDSIADYAGPLAGMLAGLEHIEEGYLLCVPCDSPFIPADLAQRMLSQAKKQASMIAVATDGNRLQPVFVLLHHSLKASLANYLDRGDRKIDLWYAEHDYTQVDFSDQIDAFININSAEELAQVEQQIAKGKPHVTASL